jgi:LysR family transcriptional activator of nhaA
VEWLNYHHLLYFWLTAREGSVTAASASLRLAQSTVSMQLRLLEESLGEKLFRREGRRLVLTDVGQTVYRYADEIFAIGRELLDVVKQRPGARPMRFRVGIVDVVPKLIAYHLLEPATKLEPPLRVSCLEGKLEALLGDLGVHRLDLVLSDAPVAPGTSVKAFNHLLGECGVTFFAAPRLAARVRRGFPKSLADAPLLLPAEGTTLRRSIDQWFDARGMRAHVVSEFEDSALLKVFGQAGAGVFPGPAVLATEIRRQYRVSEVGSIREIRERFYAISVERRLKHPAVVAISEAARTDLFA